MSIGLSEFWTRLVRQGLIEAADCKSLAMEYAKANGGTPPSDAQQLAKFMVSADRLTSFQARMLLSESPIDLRLGSFRLISDQSPSPLSRWIRVSRGQSQGYLLRTTANNPWLDLHARVSDPTLQPIEVEPIDDYVGIFSTLPPGRSLDATLAESDAAWDATRVCRTAIALADGLSSLHKNSLIHGGVRADRVWIGDDGSAILLRDPAGPPVTGLGDTSAQWLDTTDAPETYVAPESTANGGTTTECTGASDLYSLGCLLFRLYSGRRPFESSSVAGTLASHQTHSPPELVDAISRGESGDPLYRVLAYTMAKDPAARFATADQFAAAMRAVLPTLKPSAPSPTSAPVSPRPSERLPKIAVAADAESKMTRALQQVKQEQPQPDKPKRIKAELKQPKVKPAAVPIATDVSEQTLAPEPVTTESKAPEANAPQDVSPKTQSPEPEQEPTPTAPETPPARALRPRRRRKSKAPIVLTGLTVVVLMLLIALLVTDPTQQVAEQPRQRPMPTVIPPVNNRVIPAATRSPDSSSTQTPASSVTESDPATPSGYQLVAHERTLFAPPYPPDSASPPLSLIPPGPAAIVTVRLHAIRGSDDGQPIIDALSPELSGLIDATAIASGVPVDWIDRCTAALFPGEEGQPSVSMAIELVQPQPLSELLDRWQVSESQTRDGATVYAGESPGSNAFYLLPAEVASESISRYAVGPLDRITEVASIEGETIPLARSLKTLWNGVSVDADIVALVAPNFLFADGREMLLQSAPELVQPLKSVLIPNVSAMLITADISDGLVFVEGRVMPSGGISEAMLMRDIRDAVQQWPTWADSFVVGTTPDPSWRLLASRLPTMMRFVTDQFRFGISDNVIVANTYLPAKPFSQVTLATLLALNSPTGSSVAATTQPTKALSIEDMLDRKMSVSFDQESLEFALEVVANEFSSKLPEGSVLPPIRLIGGDLQKMGITQNQQIRAFAKTDIPLRTVLTDLVLGANPDKTATGPGDPKQALIWVIADDPQNAGKQAVLVTTRQAAVDRYDLPREFQTEN